MAYKWKNGKVVRISLPKKLLPENEKALEEYWQKTDITNHPLKGIFKKSGIKVIDANSEV